MNPIKIGVVEDEVIIADDIQSLLTEIGYVCPEPCSDYYEAIKMLEEETPDLILLDINLGKKKNGIDIAAYIRANLKLPFIFLTANSDESTVARAKMTSPDAYLVKPFDKSDLYAAIEIALYNFNNTNTDVTPAPATTIAHNFIFVKDGDYFHKVMHDDILFFASEHVYITLYTSRRKYLVRATVQDYIDNLNNKAFFRVHRSYVVNVNHIDKINTSTIIVGEHEIPLSKNYREDLLKMLGIG